MTQGLTKTYGRRTAVDALTLHVPSGAVAGFVGPNGAGKTTTMGMLLGLVRPSAGYAAVLGEPITHPERYLHRVGALLEGPALWPGLTGVENLRVLARLGGHDEGGIPAVLDLVGLAGRSDDRFGRYSLGMKQRLGIAAALLGDPDMLVLDEPTNGLDPTGMSDMRELIARIAAQDRTVVIASHLLAELEQVCDWLLVMDRGRLVYAGKPDEFAGQADVEVRLQPENPDDVAALAQLVLNHGLEVTVDGDVVVARVGSGGDVRRTGGSLNQAAAAAGIVLAELHVRRATLEASYLRLLEGSIT
jgi:ABC-2 type transport system ATP-binding protein